jgi:hypothetical protein
LVIVHLATPDTSERESDTLTKTGATADDATSTNVHPTRTGGGTTGDGDGSREHPLPAGTTVSVQISGGGSLDITLGEPNLNADDEIARQNDRRGRPSEGSKYIIVPVTATYHGDESALPWYDAIVEYKSPNGPTFEDSYANLDTGVLDVDDLHDGETVKYEMAIMVPDDHVEDGRMLIRALQSMSI